MSPQPTALKPVLRGLLVRQFYPGLSGVIGQVGGLVQSVPWSDIQPSQGGPIAGSKIDRTIAFARANNLTFKLRVNAGIQAPGWAKALGGAPVTVHDPQGGVGGTIGRFWTAAFGQAYSRLQAELAARYDNVPQVAEVVITRCTTVFGEPFIRQARDVQTVTNLLAAGYTAAADAACQQQQIVAHRAWLHTRSGLALNPYDHINANGTNTIDLGFTERMMLYCRQQLGSSCVLENDSIRWPTFTGKMALMYSFIRRLGPPISFQSANPPQLGDPVQTLRWAASLGANSVELCSEIPGVPLSALVTAAGGLRQNATAG